MATTVAVIYGVLTGPRVSAGFRQELNKQGYTVITDPSQADIVICHSGGCFEIATFRNNKLLLINPPYWPGKTGRQRAAARVKSHLAFRKHGYTLRQWLWRSFWGGFYGFLYVKRHIFMTRMLPKFNLDTELGSATTVIIRNQDDDWLTPNTAELIANHPNITIVHIPGDHDNCWIHPEAYVAALKSLR